MKTADTKKLVVLDGMAYAFRAFYAVPEMVNASGQAVNAVYGFANALRRAERDFKPTAAVVAFDSPGGSFRDEMLSDYKGHRDAPPESLVSQFPLIEELAEAMGWRLLKKERFEADDIIATLTRLGRKAAYEVMLMTSDKDILQLIGDGVRVYRENPKGGSLYGPGEVKERFGVGPELVADLLGLMGDASDNIPGVPGVGEKTAAKLLAEYGSLPAVLAAAPGIKGKLGENLGVFAEQARLSRRLVELKDDVGLDVAIKDLAFRGPNFGLLLPLLKRLELRALLAEYSKRAETAGVLPEIPAPPPATDSSTPAPSRAKAKTGAALGKVFSPPLSALKGKPQVEAWRKLGLDPAAPCGVAFSPEPTEGEDCPQRLVVAQATATVLVETSTWGGVRDVLAGLHAPVVLRSKALQRGLLAAGLAPLVGLIDVSLGAWLLHSTGEVRDLSEAAALLGVTNPVLAPSPGLFEPADAELQAAALCLQALGVALRSRFEAEGMSALYDGVEGPLVAVLADMENAGVKIDGGVLEGLDDQARKEMQALQKKAIHAAGRDFNLNSPAQLADVLFKGLGLEVGRKTKTGFSTDNEVLEALAQEHELPGLILEYRQLAKLSGTYLQALPKLIAADGRVHSTWNQSATATGRISSTDPNLQNIPVRSELGRRIRGAFTASKRGDSILAADYSQIELRVLAHYCRDPLLKQAFATGRDIHTETAARMHHVPVERVSPEMRARAKVINFGVLYGMGAFRVSREIGVSVKEAKVFLEDYFSQFPTVRAFLEQCKQEARLKGYAVTLLGRRRPIPEIRSANRVMREHGERVATNLPIQGTAADLIKKAMLDVDALLKKRKARTRLLMQVHDELVFELAKEEAESLPQEIQKTMEAAMRLDVPLVVETGFGGSWADAKG